MGRRLPNKIDTHALFKLYIMLRESVCLSCLGALFGTAVIISSCPTITDFLYPGRSRDLVYNCLCIDIGPSAFGYSVLVIRFYSPVIVCILLASMLCNPLYLVQTLLLLLFY